jgi:tRNA-2-methylthio-N6-dimethylallyladenosine synthase
MVNKYLYLNTIGCQMNVYDSERIAMRLAALGYQQTSSLDRADLVIVNTCTIRAKAEQKAFSFLGRLARLKKRNRVLSLPSAVAWPSRRAGKYLSGFPIWI